MSAAPKLELLGLSKSYDGGETRAVADLDLRVEAGETLALLGPSGCGKSTTLNMIVGLERPDEGRVLIDGRDVTDLPAGKRGVGLVFQDYAVFTHMTVAGNLAFGLSVAGVGRAEIRRRVAGTAELLGLTAMLKTPADRLGGSELQRVAIGRTLVTRPSILLLDEPLSNLEAETRASMRRELRRLQAETGLTIVYVTHDQVEALSLARRIAVMSDGKLRQCATVERVVEAPAHAFVAGFIGTPPMTLIEGALVRRGGAVSVEAGGLRLPAPACHAAAPASGRVVLGLRPDAIRLGAPDGGAVATVTRVEPTGPEAVVALDAAGTRLAAVVPAGARPAEGARVGLSFDPGRTALFHGDTRRNLAEATA